MNKLRIVAFASLGVLCATGAALVACGDDTSVGALPDGGAGDSSALDGASNDGNVASDGGRDAADGASVDASDGGGTDSGGSDAGDAAVVDAGISVTDFSAVLADTLCGSLARCCYGDANLPDRAPLGEGNLFQRASCQSFFGVSGFEQSSVGGAVVGGGNVVLDDAKALDCLARVKALPCDTPAADFIAARTACFGALRGTKTAGACKGHIECADGFFCKSPDGSNSSDGVCTPQRAVDGACGDFGDHNVSDPACSWRAGGNTKKYCAVANFGAGGVEILPPAQWKCAVAKPIGAACGNSTWCADGICDDTSAVCSATSNLFTNSCAKYRHP